MREHEVLDYDDDIDEPSDIYSAAGAGDTDMAEAAESEAQPAAESETVEQQQRQRYNQQQSPAAQPRKVKSPVYKINSQGVTPKPDTVYSPSACAQA